MTDSSGYRFFPHSRFRPHQREGLEEIRASSLKGVPLLFNSPTGTGKTAMVLGGILESRSDDEKLAVITRTHSQYRMFVEEFLRIKKKHSDLLFGMLVGRKNLCPMGCGPELCAFMRRNSNSEIKNGVSLVGAAKIYSYRKNVQEMNSPSCPYYINCMAVNQMRPHFSKESMDLVDAQMNEPEAPEEFFRRCMEEKYPKCPYELLKATLLKADIVVLHYQYILDPRVREAVISSNWLGAPLKKIHLVVDEAHNLAPYISDICSTECLRDDVVEAMKLIRDQRIGDIRYDFSEVEDVLTDLLLMLQDLNIYLDHYFSTKKREELLGEGVEDVLTGENIYSVNPELLNLLVNAGNSILKQFTAKKQRNEIPDDTPVPGICRVAETLKRMSESKEERYIKVLSIKPLAKMLSTSLDGLLNINDYEVSLKVVDIDPRDCVKYLVESFRSLTLISGTLYPTNLYRKLLFYDGLNVSEKSIPFPFPRENRIVFGCRDVSSQKRMRDNPLNIAAVEEILRALFSVKGNVAVFYTSYELKRKFMPFCLRLCEETGKEPMDENKEIDRAKFIEDYKAHGNAALFAVCRGSFSEGVDYIGEAMNAVAVIGLPLAPWNMKQQLINRYYEKVFGPKTGKTIAYDLPAVTAAVQAAGRCLRSPQDTGVIILGDSRFTLDGFMGVKRILPEWMREEMVVVDSRQISSLMKPKIESWKNKPAHGSDAVGRHTKEEQEVYVILETVRETGERYGTIRIAQILSGSDDPLICGENLHKKKYYGALKHIKPAELRSKIEDLVREHYLTKTGDIYPQLKLTEKGKEFLEKY